MSATGAEGMLAFGPQAAKGSAPTKWYRHRAVDIDISMNDPVQLGGLEVGGKDVPTFPYKTGPVGAGGFTLQPRLQDTLGWLLYGLTGSCTSTLAVVDNYDHVFEVGAEPIPFMGFRKAIPKVNGGANTDYGQTFSDGKIVNATIQFPNMAPVTARFDALAIHSTPDEDPESWTYENDLEDWQSIPLSCAVGGSLNVDSNTFRVVNAVASIANSPLDMRQERIAFSPYLNDITIVQRAVMFEFVVQWEDPTLVQKLRYGGAGNTTWSAKPFVAPVDLTVVSSSDMPSDTPEPYSLKIDAPSVSFRQTEGIKLAGGQAVMMKIQGTALDNASYYAKFTLRNMESGYSWPV